MEEVHFLACLDGSASGTKALEVAMALCHPSRGDRVKAVHARIDPVEDAGEPPLEKFPTLAGGPGAYEGKVSGSSSFDLSREISESFTRTAGSAARAQYDVTQLSFVDGSHRRVVPALCGVAEEGAFDVAVFGLTGTYRI